MKPFITPKYADFTVDAIMDNYSRSAIYASSIDSVNITLAENPNFIIKFGDRITFNLRN